MERRLKKAAARIQTGIRAAAFLVKMTTKEDFVSFTAEGAGFILKS